LFLRVAPLFPLSAHAACSPGTQFPSEGEYPGLERFLRLTDINGLAGRSVEQPGFVPVDFLLVPPRATDLESALAAMRWADKLCTLTSVQARRIDHGHFFKVARRLWRGGGPVDRASRQNFQM